ncbi:MAG: peptidoglycan glycosyltransferase [Epulopiscium sp. Nele67-Bin005]|nr:MAG: peptidoglycan glycosyltransferase [Epulopiscium sp. Nele67-Bin005]
MEQTPVRLKKRILVLGSILFGLFVFMSVRLWYVQVVKGAHLQELAFEQHTRNRNITQTRGTIYGANGEVLAQSASVLTVGVVRAQIEDPVQVATVLSEKLELDYDTVYQRVTRRVAFERIATKVDPEVADEIRKLNLPGVKVDEDSDRYYPYEDLAAHVLGFVGRDNQGIIGLEVKYDDYLKGEAGQILMETDGKGIRREDEAEIRLEPTDGYNLVTSIDVTIQEYAQQSIAKIVEEKNANRGSLILMNPQNGEIYAMANYPTFDANEPFTINDPELEAMWHTMDAASKQTALNQMWRNFAINDTYEPGSTFKIFTAAMGLSENVVTPDTMFTCSGHTVVEGLTIKCWRSPNNHGTQTFTQGVQNSCNPVFMAVGENIGVSAFYQYMVDFGFMRKTNIDLPGEAVGIMHKEEKIGPVELATMSFGQSFQVTPMQMLTAASSVINGGYQITPHFGTHITDKDGNIVQTLEYEQGTQIISKEVSDELKIILESVVSEGSGNKSYIPGYRIGGKTATSQKLPRGSGKYIASFMAFAPAEDPVVVALIMIDEPEGVYYGGSIAAPAMQGVLSNVLPYLGIEPVYTQEELELVETQFVEVPDVVGLTIQQAKQALYELGIVIEVEGDGTTITTQFPQAGASINKTSKIILYTN